MDTLLAALFGVASSAVLGVFKKVTGVADTKLGAVIKPVQPLIVTALAIALPHVSNALHLTSVPDAQVIAAAPTAALIGVVARELGARITKATGGGT